MEDFQSHAFHLQTIANQNLKPEKIKEYIKIVNSQFGADTCRTTLNYIIVVLGKYLMMMVAYHIYKGDLDAVEEDYDKFNTDFYQMIQDFSIVTGEEFKSGFGDEQGNFLKDINNYLGVVQNAIGLKDEKMAIKGPRLDRWLSTQLQQLKSTRNQVLRSLF